MDKFWTPNRIIFYPDGHRRWSQSQEDFEGSENATMHLSYQKGAATCVKVAEEFAKVGGTVADVFLTRPSTYVADVQERSSQSIISIHDVIREDLVEALREISLTDKNGEKMPLAINAYSRADLPNLAIPPTLIDAEIESWQRLSDAIKESRKQIKENAFQLNLLINYDGHIENEVLDQLLQRDDLSKEQRMEIGSRLLPKNPTYDMWLRTAPYEDREKAYRLSCGPSRPLGETTFVMIPKVSPEVTNEDIRLAIEQVISFRRNKKHELQPLVYGQF